MTAIPRWTVPCLDAAGRPRDLTVRPSAIGAVLGFPPAESATVWPNHARALAVALDLAERIRPLGRQATTGTPDAGVECTAGCPGVVRPTLPCPAVPELAVGATAVVRVALTAHHHRGDVR